ncbi:MAG TPA: hypothetical protein VF472_24955 [Burkholderiaceae bacterium]
MQTFLIRLELDETADERAIKRAYAREVRLVDPETDPAGFQALYDAYHAALSWIEQRTAHAPANTQAGAPIPESSVPSAPPEPSVRWPHLARPAQQLRFGDPETDAQTACTNFMRRLATRRAMDPRYDEREAAADLLAQLGDESLIQLESQAAFEYLIAKRLTKGWQAGNEVLLPAAIEVFGWERTRNRLCEFGATGATMLQAVAQWQAFRLMLAHSTRGVQILLAKLRNGRPPSDDALRFYSTLLAELTQQYPLLLPLLVPPEAIKRWLDTPQPMGWIPQKLIDMRDVSERPRPQWYPTWTKKAWRLIVGIPLVLFLSAILYHDFIWKDPGPGAQPKPAHLEDYKEAMEALKAPPTKEDEVEKARQDAARPKGN